MRFEKVRALYERCVEAREGRDPTLAYVQFMKFARRAEGIKAARSVFRRAREDVRARHHVFTAAALIEYYCSKVPCLSSKVFQFL